MERPGLVLRLFILAFIRKSVTFMREACCKSIGTLIRSHGPVNKRLQFVSEASRFELAVRHRRW